MSFNIAKAWTLVTGKIESWLEMLTSMLPNMVVAVLALLFFYILARVIRKIVSRVFGRFSDSEALNSVVSTTVYVLVIIIGLMAALNVLKLQQTVSSLLAGAGIIGLALGFAFQDIAANFMSGILIAYRKPILVGDIIETNGYMGKVEKINLRVTILRTFQGLHVIIPNKEVFQQPLTNYTKTNERRIDLEVGVSYADDLEKVKRVTEEAIGSLSYLQKDRDVKLYYEAFGDSSINFKVVFWIDYPDDPGFLTARSEAIMAIKKAYDENDITIPFPIRTLDFGIKGGKELSQMKVMEKASNGKG